MGSKIVDQVRAGLEEKIAGLECSLQYVKDPRELSRLQKELGNANAALDKLNQPDTRSAEEVEKVARMIKDDAVESAPSWSDMSAVDKFKYQMDLYFDKLEESMESAKKQREELVKVVELLGGLVGENDCIKPLYTQLSQSLREIDYSVCSIENQKKLRDEAMLAVDSAFDALDVINRFLNNPMSLPHLTEERNAELEVLRGDSKKS